MDLNNEINKNNQEPKKVLKTKKEINKEIIKAQTVLFKSKTHNLIDVNGIIFIHDKKDWK